jgi:hypothetical protein
MFASMSCDYSLRKEIVFISNVKRQTRRAALDAKKVVGHGVQQQLAVAVRFLFHSMQIQGRLVEARKVARTGRLVRFRVQRE